MDGMEFYNRILEDPRFEWFGVAEGKEAVRRTMDDGRVSYTPATANRVLIRIVTHETHSEEQGMLHREVIWEIAVKSILEQPWEELEAVLTAKRSPVNMIWMTRIVGYYSQVRNWMGSKLAELKDRHKGQYGVPGGATKVV